MILDLILIIIVALFLFIGYKKGMMKSLYGLISIIIAGVLSYILSGVFAKKIYNSFVKQIVDDKINESFSIVADNTEIFVDNVFNNLPIGLKGLLSVFGYNSGNLTNDFSATATSISNDIEIAVVSVLTTILTVVLFLLIIFLLKLLSKYILFLFEIPIIKQVNGFFGGLLGLLQGLFFVYLTVLLCKLLFPDKGIYLLSEEVIKQSVFFSKIYFSETVNIITSFFSFVKI